MLPLTLRGTALLYYGDEIGMTDVPIPPELAADPDGRDPSRTPMQWDSSPAAGFTTGQPWLPVPASAPAVNVAAERDDPGSLLNLYRQLIGLRRRLPALRTGSYQPVTPDDPAVYAYLRRTGSQRVLIAVNFDDQPRDLGYRLPDGSPILLSTSTAARQPAPPRNLNPLRLAPGEGVIIQLT
jgi:alpha-glucosidase